MKPSRSERARFEQLLAAANASEASEGGLDGVAAVWVRDCWKASIEGALGRKRLNRRLHLVFRYVAYTGALVLPILAGIANAQPESWARVWTFVVSVVVALATGALQVFKFGQQWRIHEEFASAMEAEGWSYFQRLGPYGDGGPEAYARFFERVETLRQQRGAQFIEQVGADIANLEGREDRTVAAPNSPAQPEATATGP